MAKFVSLYRDRLSNKETLQIQDAYYKGAKEQKAVIQKVFGKMVTLEFLEARVNMRFRMANEPVGISRIAGLVSIHTNGVMLNETEVWDRLCRAAYHQIIWDVSEVNEQGDILSWAEFHFLKHSRGQQLNDEEWRKAHKIPYLFPSSFVSIAKRHGIPAFSQIGKRIWVVIGAIALFVYDFFQSHFLEKLLSPHLTNILNSLSRLLTNLV